MSAATKASRTRAERRLGWLREIVAYLQQFVEFPRLNFPKFALAEDPLRITIAEIEECANQCRGFWGLTDGPVPNVVRLLENSGAVVARDALEADTLDAFSVWSSVDGVPYIVLNSEKGSAVRSRFDLAHELGHLVLHPRVSRTRLNRAAEHHLLEQQAHLFAGAFLLSASAFAEDFYVPTLDSIRMLKSKWHVSIGAMIKRARQLELMNDDQERRLWINYSRRGWRAREPLDDVLSAEEPCLLGRAIEVLIDQHVVSPAAIVDGAPPHQPADLEHLTGLPAGYLSEAQAPRIRVLQFRNRGVN